MTSQRTAAILFADIAGSSRLYKALGDARARELIGAAVDEMAATTRAFDGTVIKTIGDEVMASFPSAESGILAAIAMQVERSNSEPRTEARIGTHYGPILAHDADVFGEAVNDAADLVKIARAGQIITSEDTVAALPDHLRLRAHEFDRIPLKGAKEPTVIYRIAWEQDGGTAGSIATQVLTAAVDDGTPQPGKTLELVYAGETVIVTPDQVPFVVGRDSKAAGLPVPTEVASREHFRIDYRRGKFLLADNSTNGTWVQFAGQDSIYLRREEIALTGTGLISVGRQIQDDDPHLIRFSA